MNKLLLIYISCNRSIMKAFYFVSDIATLTGYNKYKTLEDVYDLIINYFYRINKDMKDLNSFKSIKDEFDDIYNNLSDSDKLKLNVFNDLEKIKSSGDLKENIKNITEHINNIDITDTKKQILNNFLSGKNTRDYGTINEGIAINTYKNEKNIDISNSNDKLYNIIFEEFNVYGKIDGICNRNGERYLVEIKNRKNRIFTNIPIYEQIQVQYYLKFFDDISKVLIIQKKDEQIEETIISKMDEGLWAETQERLSLITDFFKELYNDAELREEIIDKKNMELFSDSIYWI